MLLRKPFRARRARARSIMKFYDCLLEALSMHIFTKESVLLSWPFLPELSMTSIMLYFVLWVPTSVLSADMHGNISPVIIYKWYCIDKKSKRPSSQHIRLGMSYGNFNVRPSLCLRIPGIIFVMMFIWKVPALIISVPFLICYSHWLIGVLDGEPLCIASHRCMI